MFKIALDAGHYLETPGKRVLKALDPNETREWTLNNRVADYVEKLLTTYDGYEVIRVDDTTGETETTLAQRVGKANSAKADFYLSIHHNAGINGGTGGGIVAYSYKGSEKGAEWRDAFYHALINATGLAGNRANPRAETTTLYVLKNTAMPAVLLELGFMDSKTDVPVILSDEYAEACAETIVEVLAERGSLAKKETAPDDVDTNRYAVTFIGQDGAYKFAKKLSELGYNVHVEQI